MHSLCEARQYGVHATSHNDWLFVRTLPVLATTLRGHNNTALHCGTKNTTQEGGRGREREREGKRGREREQLRYKTI